ncbi:hypothetical protein WICMUC_004746 [Wickerhamomyces mucosus]|uniref:Mitochondrial intermembrane space import and assembly protein 40 n=1 Tax=Wickerhamomyces mucosus TaxID=1378264 RepID=A0A9P8PGZ8_9ASCO|nr:hypothetical protein WICMUC_004746 [Wickerhamomyces mucosus]
MQRSIISNILRSSRTRFVQNSKRSFASNVRTQSSTNSSKWIFSTSVISIALASYCLSSPLSLDADKSKSTSADTKSTENSSVPVSQEQPQSTTGEVGEEESKPQAAYDPETGEINWDCPCLGGMAHGPCGEEFKEAFSCFVYSEAEPKGFDCIEKFKNMQNCFRKYPEIYSEEIRDDEGPVDTLEPNNTDGSTLSNDVATSETPSSVVEEVLEIPTGDVTPPITQIVEK